MTRPSRSSLLSALSTVPLTEREELVLRSIVQLFILTTNPVGSRYLSKRLEEERLSAATIRNTMADLEEKGLITHPHTSAGRVPTDLGYRFYVDALMHTERLTGAERAAIRRSIDPGTPTPLLMREASRLIAAVTSQLGLVRAPEVLDGRLERIDLVPLSSSRLLVVLSLGDSMVKTVTLEMKHEFTRDRLDLLAALLNERLSGVTLRELRVTARERLRDVVDPEDPLMLSILDNSDELFAEGVGYERVRISPTQNLLRQPEFSNAEQVRGIVELIENEEVVVHLLDEHVGDEGEVRVAIGSELGAEQLADYSLVTTRYRVGTASGTVGLIGPKRMDYARMSAIVAAIASALSGSQGDASPGVS